MELDFLPHDLRFVELLHVVTGTEFPIVPALVLPFDQRLLEMQKVSVDGRVRFLEYLLGPLSGIGPGPVSVVARCDGDEEGIAVAASPSVRIPTSQQRSDYLFRFLAWSGQAVTSRSVDNEGFVEAR